MNPITTRSIRLLLVGCNGQVGSSVRKLVATQLGDDLDTMMALDYPELDLCKPDMTLAALREFKPTVILNAAAYTNVEKAEDEPAVAHAINAEAVGLMGEYAKQAGALMIHYSTDYVFDGTKTTPYVETDTVNPQSVYGDSKAKGDLYLQQIGCDYLTFRTSWVFSRDGDNFYRKILRFADKQAQAGLPLSVVQDQLGAPTPARWLAEIGLTAAKRRAHSLSRQQGDLPMGLFNATAAGQTTWHEYAQLAIQTAQGTPMLSRAPEVLAVNTASMNFKAKRPAYSVLDNSRLVNALGVTQPDWKTSVLDDLLADIQESMAPTQGT